MQNKIKNITLSNGLLMPSFGLGTFQTNNKLEIINLLRSALDLGYRHIDTAIFYENEALIGDSLDQIFSEGHYKRSDLFIVTKIFPYKKYNTLQYIQKSLSDLKIANVDLLYLHWPMCPLEANDVIGHKPTHQIWKELEECYDLGLTKALGVSNFNVQSILDLLSYCRVKPVTNQVELNVYLQQPLLLQFCSRFNIHVTAYSPLARGQIQDSDGVLQQIANKYGKTVPQVMLNFLLRLDVSVIPKTTKAERLKENIESVDFEMEQEDFQKIKLMDINQRVIDPTKFSFFNFLPLFN